MRTLKLLFAASLLMGLFACGSTKKQTYTIAQYNVGAFSKYDGSSVDAIARAVKEMQADVVSFNEVDSCTTRTGSVDQMDAFTKAMGDWNQHYGAAMPYKGGAYGNGVASSPQMEIIRKDVIHLPKFDGRETRSVALVEYKDFVYCSAHLDLTEASQLGQIEVINHYMDSVYKDSPKPILIGGDFNCEPGSAPVELMLKSWALLSPETFSFPSHKPIKCIDFIFARPNGKKIVVERTEIPVALQTVDLATASDHLPVLLEISIVEQTAE